jgi:hypothetical protein
MSKTASLKTLKKIILSSKQIVLTHQHILTRDEFTHIQLVLVEKFEELDIRIIGKRVILNIPNNLRQLLIEKNITTSKNERTIIAKS